MLKLPTPRCFLPSLRGPLLLLALALFLHMPKLPRTFRRRFCGGRQHVVVDCGQGIPCSSHFGRGPTPALGCGYTVGPFEALGMASSPFMAGCCGLCGTIACSSALEKGRVFCTTIPIFVSTTSCESATISSTCACSSIGAAANRLAQGSPTSHEVIQAKPNTGWSPGGR